MVEPVQKPGKSKQDYATPNDFIEAVTKKFGKIDFDLAANQTNTKAEKFYSEEDASLSQDWTKLEGNLWLNPPFSKIKPWAEKCKNSIGANKRILFLTPASIGSNWFYDNIYRFAKIYALKPRLQFEGCEDPYIKDCMLSCYGETVGFEVWNWK